MPSRTRATAPVACLATHRRGETARTHSVLAPARRSIRCHASAAPTSARRRPPARTDRPSARPTCVWLDPKGSKKRLAKFDGEGLACVGRVRLAVRRTKDAQVLGECGRHGRIPSCQSCTNLPGANLTGCRSGTPHQPHWQRGGEAARNVRAETYHLMS